MLNRATRLHLITAPDRMEFFIGGERVAAYRTGPENPGFTGIFAPEGRSVTRIERADGLALWTGHGDVNGVSFGVEPKSVERRTGNRFGAGPVRAGFSSVSRQVHAEYRAHYSNRNDGAARFAVRRISAGAALACPRRHCDFKRRFHHPHFRRPGGRRDF